MAKPSKPSKPKVSHIIDISSLNKELLKTATVADRKEILSLTLGKIRNTGNFGGKKELRQNKFTMFHKGIPVDETTFVNAVLNALKNNKVPAEEGLILQEFSTLPESMQNAWELSGFKETSWSAGAISRINRQLSDSNEFYFKLLKEGKLAESLLTIEGTYNIVDYASFFKQIVLANIQNIRFFPVFKKIVVYLKDMNAIIVGIVHNAQEGKKSSARVVTPIFETKTAVENIKAPVYYNNNFLSIPTSRTAMGHGIAEQTQDVQAELAIIRAAKADTTDQGLKDLYTECENILEPILKGMEAIDRLQIETSARLNSTENLSGQLSSLILYSSLIGADEIVIVDESSPGVLQAKSSKLPLKLSVNTVFPEPASPNSWKGRKQQLLQGLWAKFLANSVDNEQFWTEYGNLIRSTPFFMASILKALTVIFDDKSFESSIVKSKRKAVRQIIKTKKAGKKLSTDKLLSKFIKRNNKIKKAAKELRKGPKNFRNKISRGRSVVTQQTESIVPLINAELKRYLLEEMIKGNALRNRSGVFASSVKVLSAEEEAAVQYTYEANPYSIFERPPVGRRNPKTGKMASPAPFYLDRRPSEIIDKAIKRIGQDRFQKVFRTQKV